MSDYCRWNTCHKEISSKDEGENNSNSLQSYLCPFHIQLAHFILVEKMKARPFSSSKICAIAGYKECCKYLPSKKSFSSSFSEDAASDDVAQIISSSQILQDLEEGEIVSLVIDTCEREFLIKNFKYHRSISDSMHDVCV